MYRQKARNIAGPRIRLARAMHMPPLTQMDLAAQLEAKGDIPMSVNILSRVENAERYITDVELKAFSKALRVSMLWLLGETNDPAMTRMRNDPAGDFLRPGHTVKKNLPWAFENLHKTGRRAMPRQRQEGLRPDSTSS